MVHGSDIDQDLLRLFRVDEVLSTAGVNLSNLCLSWVEVGMVRFKYGESDSRWYKKRIGQNQKLEPASYVEEISKKLDKATKMFFRSPSSNSRLDDVQYLMYWRKLEVDSDSDTES